MAKRISLYTAIFIGGLTLIGLLFSIPAITTITLTWGMLFAAIALLLGVVNLFNVHIRRLLDERNLYSGILIITMLLVFLAAITDFTGQTNNLLGQIFIYVQMPLEMALSSLLAFFLLFATINLLKRNRTPRAFLFLLIIILVLAGGFVGQLTFVPQFIADTFVGIITVMGAVVVTAGVRGILIGVALGSIMLSIRLLLGLERPYNK